MGRTPNEEAIRFQYSYVPPEIRGSRQNTLYVTITYRNLYITLSRDSVLAVGQGSENLQQLSKARSHNVDRCWKWFYRVFDTLSPQQIATKTIATATAPGSGVPSRVSSDR